MFKKVLSICMVTFLVLAAFTGCGGSKDTGSGDAAKEDEKPTIAVVLKALNNPFMAALQEGCIAAGEELGANVTVLAPEKETDVEKQVQIVDDLIAKRVDAIVLSAAGPVELLPSIKKANEAGIPVLLVNDTIDDAAATEQGATYLTHIGTDNYTGAKMAGEFVLANIKEAKIAILEGVAGVPALEDRLTGFEDVIKANPKLEIVASQNAECDRDKGYAVMQNILTANPDITLVWAATESMGLGAYQAAAQMGKADQMQIIVFDASDETKEAIKAGQIYGAIEQHPDQMGKVAIENALKAIKGETIETKIASPVNLVTAEDLK